MSAKMREEAGPSRFLPIKSIDAIWSSCGCHAALIINPDGTSIEWAHEVWCPEGRDHV